MFWILLGQISQNMPQRNCMNLLSYLNLLNGVLHELTSIKSLFAPSATVARLSYWSGSKSVNAAVKYSPAGVFFTFSESDLTRATILSFLSAADANGTSIGCPLLVSFLPLYEMIPFENLLKELKIHHHHQHCNLIQSGVGICEFCFIT